MRKRRTIVHSIILTIAGVHAAAAQSQAAARPLPTDSVFIRARQLVLDGKGAAGRVLVDSVVAASEPDTPAYAEALYWRATLAAESADAENDFRRIIVEYPLSRRAGDALLQLGQLEAARGDRADAASHLERFLLENPHTTDRARIGLQVVRLSFDMNDAVRGCTTLGRVLNDVPASAVEMRNQLAYFSPRCVGVDTTGATARAAAAAAALDSAKASASKAGKSASRDSEKSPTTKTTPKATPKATAKTKKSPARDTSVDAPVVPAPSSSPSVADGKFTLQVAAYTSRIDAEYLVKKLETRGLDARVVGDVKLFRVRVGHYPTRAAAAAAAKILKAKKIDAFITESGDDDR